MDPVSWTDCPRKGIHSRMDRKAEAGHRHLHMIEANYAHPPKLAHHAHAATRTSA
jgi:hypothetical protein